MIVCKREVINRQGSAERPDGGVYLERFILFKCAWVTVMLHKFINGDDDCPHDHPWSFVSLLLAGRYVEWWPRLWGQDWSRPDRPGDVSTVSGHFAWYSTVRRAWTRTALAWRPAKFTHRITIGDGHPVSLVITGPRWRRWVFLTKLGRWVHWQAYRHADHCAA